MQPPLDSETATVNGPAVVSRSRLTSLLHSAADDWGVSTAAILVILIVPFLVVFGGVAAAAAGKEAYKWYISEDRFAENLQFLAFAAAGVFALWTSARVRRGPDRFAANAFLLLGLALLWVAGEEISWGQRIFGIATPESLEEINRQSELNIHNIYPVELALRWAQFFVGAWGAVLPLVVWRYADRLGRWRRHAEYAIPHYTLIVYFGCTMLWRAYRNLAPPPPERFSFVVAEWSEVMELNFALGLMLFMYYQLRRAQRRHDIVPEEPARVPVAVS